MSDEIPMKREMRARQAAETLRILETGQYESANGTSVNIGAAIRGAVARTVLYTPADWEAVVAQCDEQLERTSFTATISVAMETTLCAARRLVTEYGCERALCLNFASAKNPGGGFIGGSQAQEESLARSSALYATLMAKPVYYERNRQCGTTLYTDHMVLSPDVPVFRDDHGQFLAEPYLVSFITAPAVNAGVIRRSEAHNVERIAQTMAARIRYVLAVAVVHGYEHLVLGAWGCGVFRNDPDEIAGLFEEHLQGTGAFAKAFRTVVFAVLCRRRDESTIRPFRARFGQEI